MAWKKEAITDGEIDALRRTALTACNDDTRYPLWRGASTRAGGHCYVIARWLVQRLGGYVGADHGHYVWLSPDDGYYIDLTAAHGRGERAVYARNTSYHRVDIADNDRTQRFSKRADRIFDSLDRLIRLSLDYAGDAYPAEETQRQDDRDRFNDSWTEPDQYWHDEPDPTTPEGVYNFVYAQGQLEVSPNHGHEELAGHAGINPEVHTGPFAAGHVAVTNGRATWEVQANVNLHSFFRILKDATKDYGWQWGGMTDASGQPIIEQFAPKKSAKILHYVLLDDHLFLGRTSAADLAAQADRDGGDGRVCSGALHILGDRVWVHSANVSVLPHLFDWAADNGLRLFAGNDNVIKTIPDLQEENNYNPSTLESPNPEEPPVVDERLPSGLYRCPGCNQLFPNWNEYSRHRPECAEWAGSDNPEANGDNDRFPPGQHDPIYGDGAHYHELRQEPGVGTVGKVVVLPARSWREAARVDGFMRYATAFKYDNDDYLFYVAYRNGDPISYAAVGRDGNVQMMHSAVENVGAGTAIFRKLTQHFDSLYTNAAHEKTEQLLKRHGWVQAKGVMWRWAKDQAPTDMLDAPLPFIYDVQEDKIHIGHPGARQSDIPGRFTPGGIVEGTYEPGGKVLIRSMTSIPYTVRHMIELWYYTHPQLEVKSVHLQDDAGKDTRLASSDIGSYVKQLAAIDPAVHTASRALMQAGGQVYVVGGAVRDVMLGKDPQDIDLMVTGIPEPKVAHILKALPGNVVQEGQDFKVFHYRTGGSDDVHIALPRRERSTGAGHQQFEVQTDHTMKPEDDFYRRDFTANAMGVNLANGRLVDPFGGTGDIASRTLRTLNDKSLGEDPLRIARALVAHARHGLDPDETTRAQMRDYAHALEHLPPERIQPELDKIFGSENPSRAIRLAHETGVLKHILPEVDAAFGYNQNNPHHELELGDHLLSVLDRISKQTQDPDLRLAALLHDIGKPGSAWLDPETGSNHYYESHLPDGSVQGANHERLGAELAASRLKTLKYPTDRIRRVRELVAGHMFPGFSTSRGARRFMNAYGPHADDLLQLRLADQGGGKTAYPTNPALSVDRQRSLVEQVRNANEPTGVSQLAVDGNDLIRLGIPPSPVLGQTLNYLAEKVIDDPTLNQPQILLQLAQEFAILNGDEESIQTSTESPGDREAHSVQEQGLSGEVDAALPPAHTALQQSAALKHADTDPYFPSEQEATEANQEAYARWAELFGDDPTWGGVLKPNELGSALGAAQNHYAYGPEEDEGERLGQAAAKMGWRIAGNQVFTNGNKRTAYWTMREMLDRNGLGHLSPLDYDDVELADHLVGQDRYGADRTMQPEQLSAERARLENEWLEMWRQRYYAGEPNLNYQQLYPEGTYVTSPEEAAQNPPDVPPRD